MQRRKHAVHGDGDICAVLNGHIAAAMLVSIDVEGLRRDSFPDCGRVAWDHGHWLFAFYHKRVFAIGAAGKCCGWRRLRTGSECKLLFWQQSRLGFIDFLLLLGQRLERMMGV